MSLSNVDQERLRACGSFCASASRWTNRSTSSRWAVLRHQPLGWPNKLHELGRIGLAQAGTLARLTVCHRLGTHSPDSSAIVPATKVDAASRRLRDKLRMLDQLAIHVDDVECSIGTGGQVDRAKCRIGRGEELSALFDSAGDEGHARGFENSAVHQVCERLAHEGVAVIRGGEQVASFDRSGRNWR